MYFDRAGIGFVRFQNVLVRIKTFFNTIITLKTKDQG
jgi:hypothetical protein